MKVYIIAGEPSGDLLAAGLIKALRSVVPDAEFRGIGGEAVAAAIESSDNKTITASFYSLFDISEIAVMGLFEVIPRLPVILKRINQTINDIEEFKPDVVVTVDSWGFVSTLIGKLRKRSSSKRRREATSKSTEGSSSNIYERGLPPVVHYVAPQVWAWKKGRARSVARLVDRLMTLLPDERQYFEKYGLKCDFVGHPVVERIARADLDAEGFRTANAIPPEATVVSLLPGSRPLEIKRMLSTLKQAVSSLTEKHKNLFVVVPTVSTVADEVRRSFEDFSLPALVVTGEMNRYNAFAASTIAIAKSGTVSLELAAVGVPHLIAYTFNKASNWAAKRFVKVRFANLINLLADREIIPEFVLDNFQSDLIAAEASKLLSSHEVAEKQVIEARHVMRRLRLPNILPSQRAAQVVIEAARGDVTNTNLL